MCNKLISLVIPVYNESESVYIFMKALSPILEHEQYDFEIIFINDGSTDNTLQDLCVIKSKNNTVKIIDLSRNFGKELAMAAGFEAATGVAVIPMDVDLQDPPELICDFLRQWERGYDVVVGVRTSRNEDTLLKRKTAALFYRIFRKMCDDRLIANAGYYRLMDRKVVDALNSLPERVRFTKGLYAWLGFSQSCVEYSRPARIAGKSSWKIWNLWNFAIDGFTSFSTFPLRVWSYFGIIVSFFGFFYALFIFAKTLLFGIDVPGYASLMVVVLVLGGLVLTSLGILGEYIGRIFIEVKGRPLYIINKKIGFVNSKHCISNFNETKKLLKP